MHVDVKYTGQSIYIVSVINYKKPKIYNQHKD